MHQNHSHSIPDSSREAWFWLLGAPLAVVACLLMARNVFAVFAIYHLGFCLVLPAAKNFLRRRFTVRDHLEFLARTVSLLPVEDYRFLGWWVMPYITDALSTEDHVTRIIGKVRNQRPLSRDEIGSFCHFGMSGLLRELRKTSLRTIQLRK